MKKTIIIDDEFQISDREKYESWRELYKKRSTVMWREIVKWAKLMEEAIATGAQVEDIAQKLVFETRIPKLPNNGWPITVLYQCWEYGADLEKIEDYNPWCSNK